MNGLLAKINHVISSNNLIVCNLILGLEASYTCFECMEILSEPMTIVPCGHNVCKRCDNDKLKKWPKCKETASLVIPDNLLKEAIGKYLFQLDIVAAFTNEDIWNDVNINL